MTHNLWVIAQKADFKLFEIETDIDSEYWTILIIQIVTIRNKLKLE